MSVTEVATRIVKLEEGFRSQVYLDHLGYPTIGYGLLLSKGTIPADFPEMPEAVASVWLSELLDTTLMRLGRDRDISYLLALDDIRLAVVVSMVYQLGFTGFKGFVKTLEAIAAQEFDLAASHMLDSRWAKQTPERAERHARMMMTGVLLSDY